MSQGSSKRGRKALKNTKWRIGSSMSYPSNYGSECKQTKIADKRLSGQADPITRSAYKGLAGPWRTQVESEAMGKGVPSE